MINPWRWRPRVMKQKAKRNAKGRAAKTVLRLPDLEVAKSAVLNSLSCPDAQRGYRHAIDEFVDWYCSEPRLSFSKTVVLRYRMRRKRALSVLSSQDRAEVASHSITPVGEVQLAREPGAIPKAKA